MPMKGNSAAKHSGYDSTTKKYAQGGMKKMGKKMSHNPGY